MSKIIIILTTCLFVGTMGGGLRAQKLIRVTDEILCSSAPTVYIGNIIRRVTVVTTHENKVRLVTTVAVEGNCRLTNEEWLEKLELKVSGTSGDVNVKCGNMEPMGNSSGKRLFFGSPTYPHHTPDLPQRRTLNNLTPNGTVVFGDDGSWLYKKGNIRRDIIVYVPFDARLEIQSRYSETILDSNVREVNALIMSGGLTMKDADRLVLNSEYGSIYASNIRDAEVTLNHGWFHAKDMSGLEIDSKVSTVELGVIGRLKIHSNDDQYEMEAAGDISGEKNFGSIRVVTLKNSLDLTGVNADVKVHNIDQGVSMVKIDDRYADLRLPVFNLKDYTVSFEGSGTNFYAPFETPGATYNSFNVSEGNGKKHVFRLKCSNCTVDMK